MLFPDLPEQEPKEGREAQLVKKAVDQHAGCGNVFVDCSSSTGWRINAANVCPALTPSHPYYSTYLKRYLTGVDFMHLQGHFESTMPKECYDWLVQNQKLAMDLSGNSFSSTVCQAAIMSAFAAAPEAVQSMGYCSEKQPEPVQEPVHRPILKRIRAKRSAPEYDSCVPAKPAQRSNRRRKTKNRYKRKKPGIDSRKKSKGKKECATIWQRSTCSICGPFFLQG